MKGIFSVVVLVALCLSGSAPLFAQKGKTAVRGPRILLRSPIPGESVKFQSVRALSEGRGAWVEWQMQLETNNIGFNVYRIDGKGKRLVSESLILGSAARYGRQTAYGETYSFFDPDGYIGSVYVVESVLMDGRRSSSQAFAALYTSDLRAVSGFSAEEYFAKPEPLPEEYLESSGPDLPKDLKYEVDINRSLADIDTQRWVASQPGAKIGVKKDGMYRVTRAELQTAGFNVNSDPALWQLYTDGVQQSISVGTNGDHVEFYGKGIDTIESETRMYYLLVGNTAGKRIGTRILRPGIATAVAPNYFQTFEKRERFNYISSIINGEAENYWGRVFNTTSTTLNFNLSGVDLNASGVHLVVKFQGFSPAPHSVGLVLNGETLSPAAGNGQSPFSAEYDLPVSTLREGANTLQMRSLNAANDTNLFDSIKLTFGRKHVADQNRLAFYTRNYRAAVLDGFTSANIRLFDMTIDGDPVLLSNVAIQQNGGTFGTKIPASRGRVFYAVEDTGLLQPASLGPNIPSTLSTPAHNAQLVIISYKDWMTEAENWANYRRQQGFSVEVVNVDDIFDEFNFGVLSANSIRSFLEYAKNNWQTPPQYVLLLGDGCYDSKNYEGQIVPPRPGSGFFNFVPAKIVNTIYSETASDDALADFNGDGLSEIAIGRIPARNAQTVTNALAKVMAFEQPPMQTLDRGAIFAYDVPNGYDFGGMSQRLRAELPQSVPTTFISRGLPPPNQMQLDPNAPANLRNAINTGKYIVNYSGHGTTGTWGGSNALFSVDDVQLLTNANSQSLFTMLTCLNGFFHNLVNESFAEKLVYAQNGGAVAVWASSGLTTPDIQEIMAKRFYNQIGIGNITRMGDLIRDAKTTVPGGQDVRYTWVLVGDPMLKVRQDPPAK